MSISKLDIETSICVEQIHDTQRICEMVWLELMTTVLQLTGNEGYVIFENISMSVSVSDETGEKVFMYMLCAGRMLDD
jgi:hypothetical protein